MYQNEIYISPKYILEDYLDLNLSLNSNDQDWDKAIDIFADRIEGRFLLLIQHYSDNIRLDNRYIDYSFSSMALCCLLIETLHQFYNGLDITVFRGHKEAFVKFLTRSFFFSRHFTCRTASFFYSDIRNGILHQAQTKRNTQLSFNQENMVTEIDNGIRLDVIKFKDELLSEYQHYLDLLKQRMNSELRDNFIRKMNYITTVNNYVGDTGRK
ncbi:hypothetical protein [Paenibacillus macerans]|uniref:hypothetical protein n=1 Tax=Paenibacillus macerans TaxID=44252 RepID=UPI003D31F614